MRATSTAVAPKATAPSWIARSAAGPTQWAANSRWWLSAGSESIPIYGWIAGTTEPGVYFLGLPWLSRRGSSFIWGVWHDAKYLAGHIETQRGYLAYEQGRIHGRGPGTSSETG